MKYHSALSGIEISSPHSSPCPSINLWQCNCGVLAMQIPALSIAGQSDIIGP